MLHRLFSRKNRSSASNESAPVVAEAQPIVPLCHPRELAYAFNGLLLGRSDEKRMESGALSPIEARVGAEVQKLLVNGLSPDDLPRLPSTIPQLLEMLDRQPHMREIAALINRDPALAMEVVSLANSPLFRRSREPAKTVEAAFASIGENGIRALLVASGMRPMFEVKVVYFRLFGRLLWQHALDCAHACAVLAPKRRVDPAVAFFTGLVHDVGKLAVFQRTLAAFTAGGPDVPLRPVVFQTLIQEFAPKLTQQICESWNIHPEVRAAIAQQNVEGLAAMSPLARILYTANALAETHMLLTERVVPRETLIEYLQSHGIPWSALYEPFPEHNQTLSAGSSA